MGWPPKLSTGISSLAPSCPTLYTREGFQRTCLLRRAAVRNLLRSWLNPELVADPLLLLGAGGEVGQSANGLADPFPPFRAVVF
jgi:hypothetical protein